MLHSRTSGRSCTENKRQKLQYKRQRDAKSCDNICNNPYQVNGSIPAYAKVSLEKIRNDHNYGFNGNYRASPKCHRVKPATEYCGVKHQQPQRLRLTDSIVQQNSNSALQSPNEDFRQSRLTDSLEQVYRVHNMEHNQYRGSQNSEHNYRMQNSDFRLQQMQPNNNYRHSRSSCSSFTSNNNNSSQMHPNEMIYERIPAEDECVTKFNDYYQDQSESDEIHSGSSDNNIGDMVS